MGKCFDHPRVRVWPYVLSAAVLGFAPAGAFGYFRPAPRFAREAVAADNVDASRAGASVLAAGGNAVDAAIATALALGVVSPSSSGFGGGGFATVCSAAGDCTFYDFRETAPRGLTSEVLSRASEPSRATHVGPLAVGVPGEPMGFLQLARSRGRLPFARLVAPAVTLARRGFAVSPWLASAIAADREALRGDSALSAWLLPGGAPLTEGARVTRPALARTLERYGREGEAYLRGAFATAFATALSARGGVLTAAEVGAYRAVERAPLRVDFAGHTVVTAPYPSAGGLLVAETLAMVEGVGATRFAPGSSGYFHLLAESFRGAFDDRARYVGDPDNAGVTAPERLFAAERMGRRVARFDPERAGAVAVDEPARDHGTTHLCVIDAEGNVVSMTSTVNEAFGARLEIPALGVIANDQIDDFSLGAGSSYGLAASRPNALVAGRRPVSSMAPTVVLRGGRPVGCVGASGGPRIATATAQVLLNLLVHRLDPEAAVSAPRIHHQGAPNELRVEAEIADDVREGLRRRGYTVTVAPPLAVAQALWVDTSQGRRVLAATDPRKNAPPAGR